MRDLVSLSPMEIENHEKILAIKYTKNKNIIMVRDLMDFSPAMVL